MPAVLSLAQYGRALRALSEHFSFVSCKNLVSYIRTKLLSSLAP